MMPAMSARQRDGGGPASPSGSAAGIISERLLGKLGRALKRTYEMMRSYRLPDMVAVKLGRLAVEIFEELGGVVFVVLERGNRDSLCVVKLAPESYGREPYFILVNCEGLKNYASDCARGEGCALSWEEMGAALWLAKWAANTLAELAKIPFKVEAAGFARAYSVEYGKSYVLPYFRVSPGGREYAVHVWASLVRGHGESWQADGDLRLIRIDRDLARALRVIMELKEEVERCLSKLVWENYSKKDSSDVYRGEYLKLYKVSLSHPHGAEVILLEPALPLPARFEYIGEDFAVVNRGFPLKSNEELSAELEKDIREVAGAILRVFKHLKEADDSRYVVFGYLLSEALKKAKDA